MGKGSRDIGKGIFEGPLSPSHFPLPPLPLARSWKSVYVCVYMPFLARSRGKSGQQRKFREVIRNISRAF